MRASPAFRARPVFLVIAVAVLSPILVGCKGLRGGATDGGTPDASVDARAPLGDAGGASARATMPTDAGATDEAIAPTSSDELTVRARHLLEAIAQDNADLASDILFPRDGWLATRDAMDPGKDWEKRAASPFRRGVHARSRRHRSFDRAQFASLELGHAMVQVTPRKHGWTKPLWTVSGSRITFMVDGRTQTLPIHEMTAWRGAWYVTRL